MTIDPIKKPQNITGAQPSKPLHPKFAPKPVDKVSISDKAHQQALIQNYLHIVKSTPDIREDIVNQAKQNLPQYFDDNGNIRTDVIKQLTDLLSNHIP